MTCSKNIILIELSFMMKKLKSCKKKSKINDNEYNLLDKVFEQDNPLFNSKISSDSDFIDNFEPIKEMIKDKTINDFKNVDFDYEKLGKFDQNIHVKILFNKIKNNLEIYDYLKNINALPENNDYNQYLSEKLYIDILFEKNLLIKKFY